MPQGKVRAPPRLESLAGKPALFMRHSPKVRRVPSWNDRLSRLANHRVLMRRGQEPSHTETPPTISLSADSERCDRKNLQGTLHSIRYKGFHSRRDLPPEQRVFRMVERSRTRLAPRGRHERGPLRITQQRCGPLCLACPSRIEQGTLWNWVACLGVLRRRESEF